ncbi:hypothetical protein PR202_gb16379 [Eleusine coracana subsp. coracana]|uniref:WH1 domain-containing protein n=1 Tax=Eleusine coracana subsp. coracana TaxID=191504 RepID=A0AAV5EY13_ELECO|nr:hypothetical protein PR202_gb16379 [Eleusine coracana subsp. coracana]
MPPPAPPQPTAGKVTPNLAMDTEATRMLNLTVLQRLDPAVEDILITAAHVTLYDFNIDLNQWSRKDVEGSLFVVKRNTQPRFQFIVMNRRNTDNLVEDLLSDFEYELQPPYLLYRNAAQEVNGIWFYNQHDCEAVASLFGRILNAYAKVPPKAKVPSTKSEFEELEAVPTSAAIDGPLEPPPAATAVASDAPDESLVNYFNGAANIGTFFAPPSSSSPSLVPPGSSVVPTAPPLHPTPVSAQRPQYGTPLLQPFPPPTPPPSLTPAHNDRPVVTRDRVKDALQRLVQNDEFIDFIHRELQKSLV